MARLDKEKWLSAHPYEFEKDEDDNLWVLDTETWIKEQAPDNSMTKFILRKLRAKGVLE